LFAKEKNNKQNTILNNKIVALCFKVKAITKKIITQKQIATTKKILVAQKL